MELFLLYPFPSSFTFLIPPLRELGMHAVVDALMRHVVCNVV